MYADDQREILFGRTELDAMIVRLGGVECAAGEEEEACVREKTGIAAEYQDTFNVQSEVLVAALIEWLLG